MSSHNEPVKPTPFEVASPSKSPPAQEPPPAPSGAWIVPTLVLLLALVAVVVFWLPGKFNLLSTDDATRVPDRQAAAMDLQISAQAPSTPNRSPSELPQATPWSDAQQARLRLAAQDVLAELLDLQFKLEEQGVKGWAPGAFADAAAQAGEGDILYRQQDYEEATEHYRASLAVLRELAEGLPQRHRDALDTAAQSIEKGDVASATESLRVAASIEPDDEELLLLQGRLQQLPEILTLLAQARKSESTGDLDAAAAALERARELDPLHRGTAQALDRVAADIRERDFQAAMSAGYTHLNAARFDAARESFKRADERKPGSAEAASALREVASAATAARLTELQRQGQAQQAREEWQAAVHTYEQALKIDGAVLFATQGLRASRERAQLDAQLREILDNPQRLAEQKIAAQSSDLLRHARQVSPQGKLLLSQIGQLDVLLQRARTPVPVSLRSDGATEVLLYKVARLGTFERHELKLRPGTYTAVGTRNGYRDVRIQFTVDFDGDLPPVTIACTEQI